MMAAVTVTIPQMLATLVKSGREIEVKGGKSVSGVLDGLFTIHPELRVHVFNERGEVRPHVRCFHNETSVYDLSEPVADGDTVTILQAVSGGV